MTDLTEVFALARRWVITFITVHPNIVTYEFLSGGQSVTQSLDVFLAVFTQRRR